MPELPDVEIFKNYFYETSLNKSIEDIKVKSTKILDHISTGKLTNALIGRSFKQTLRRGKYLFAQTDSDVTLAMHFGMTGSLEYVKTDYQLPQHGRLVIFFKDTCLVFVDTRLFGRVTVTNSLDEFIKQKDLGPDALDIGQSDFKDRISHSKAAIKAVLMDQSVIAGLGNIYTDEVLFQSRIHPKTSSGELTEKQVEELYKNMRCILKKAISVDADPGKMPEDWLIPKSRKKNASCPKCHGKVEKITVASRSTYFCPKCQSEKRG